MMLAETAYNVIQALPEAEKERLFSMLKLESKVIKPKLKKDDGHYIRDFSVQTAVDFCRERDLFYEHTNHKLED
ncbi:hypothetical protein R1T16_05625 [Flavobacterium sp. DG1-102-2]|uniref:hypothetical protein n=1 Tax=Flavobacterium sp. DG1-102-2 TaxID=3081663 RepID=UPI002948D539|nr:hypothetical protein [Flavobacterium sp. DG1-102-2]MDV6167895.1 hypothetical protein [Flavobacterium sp. DG1-102-2]